MTTRARTSGTAPHIVISTKELQSIDTLEEFYSTQKGCLTYAIAVEYGENGHPHLESFSTWDKELRQDKIKAKIIKLFDITDYHGKMNTKVTFNHIDSDVMYGFGYTQKEAPKEFRTNLQPDYLLKCQQYYNDHQEAVNAAKKEISKEYVKVHVNGVIDDFIDWLYSKKIYCLMDKHSFNGNGTNANNFKDKFTLFYSTYTKRLPYTEYSKIREESVKEYINMELLRKGGTFS